MAVTDRGEPVVLMGFAQAFAAVEATWSLVRAGMHVVAFGRRGAGTPLSRMHGVEVHEITAPETSAAQAIADIEALVRRAGADVLLPLDDASLWLLDRARVGAVPSAGPDRAGAALALDKREQLEAARAAGLSIPPTQEGTAASLHGLSWPVVIKPAHPVRVVDDRLIRPRNVNCADHADLVDALPGLGNGPVLCQPLIGGIGEGVFGYVDASGPVLLTAHRRVRMVNPQGSASSACESIEVDPALAAPVTRMLAAVHWRGLFMVEFLRDGDGVPWFMELNGRAWGSLALARRRGFEYPAWAVQHALGLPQFPDPPAQPPHVVARHLGREIAHLLFVLRGPRSRAVAWWPSRRRTIAALLRVGRDDRLYNWNSHEPLVLATDTVGTLRELIAGRSRGR
ncbi:ATP-grasp domain-containing protein [Microbacterium allomyrinae]|uniref:ATP-grasp domain-containing protein n=1 Tax=Microbacterium allomyrinae TaxID=2830666 RepID=A0A9X1S2U0_9MICO|nr:ATP-grasp domain-containing protein [Microbacterium allomyrinae]MCC2033026.1 ATP-grasp domain-containing protein [Microbacterium allomyrinae]